MKSDLSLTWRHLLVSIWLAGATFLPISHNAESTLIQDECSPGQVQADTVSLGALLLPEGAPPFTTTTLTRLVVRPGETLTPAADRPELYFVESGSLGYKVQPNIGVMGGTECISVDGSHQSTGGTILESAGGIVTLGQGQAVIAEHGMKGFIVNDGKAPLILLRVSVIAPEIDPASGLPIVDPATLGREQARARDELKQACKAEAKSKRKRSAQASPSSGDSMEEPTNRLATPAASTAGWTGDTEQAQLGLPRSCKDPS